MSTPTILLIATHGSGDPGATGYTITLRVSDDTLFDGGRLNG